ncbi:Uncharacterised protein [Mycobacteroides abscessus subsp. abscessus]|nr:Uncharacterised protein [Mycobacteroides abscessus subsp. abscessus]SKZ20877.1 Uncharacterised protein [Mycobacteroides abscessus subsp. abscessus]
MTHWPPPTARSPDSRPNSGDATCGAERTTTDLVAPLQYENLASSFGEADSSIRTRPTSTYNDDFGH